MNAPTPAGALVVATAPLGRFAPSLFNRKHKPEYIAELAESMKLDGVMQPIRARPWPASRGKAPAGVECEIIFGEGRWLAAQKAGLAEIPYFWCDVDDRAALRMQLIENLKRKDLTPIEEAEGYRRLMKEHGLTAEVGDEKKSRSYIYGRLKLLDLCPGALKYLEAGKIDASTALLIARIPDVKLQEKAAKEIAEPRWHGEDAMSYRRAAEHVQSNFMLKLAEAPFSRADESLIPTAGRCHDCPKRTGNQKDLFSDVKSADVCTDPTCYEAKKAAHAKRQQQQAKAEGRKLIQGDDARKLKPNSWSDVGGGYIDLDKTVQVGGKSKTVRQILGDDAPKPDLLADPHKQGKIIEVVPTATIRDQLEAKGVLSDVTNGRLKSEKEKAAQRASKLREKIDTTFSQRLFDQIRSRVIQEIDENDAPYLKIEEERMVLQRFFDLTSYGLQCRVARLWLGPKNEKANDYNLMVELKERIPEMDSKEIAKLMLDLTLIDEAGLASMPKRMLDMAKNMALDADALKVEIRKELTPKEKVKAVVPKAKVQPKTATPAADALQVGDRVKVKEGVKGPTGHLRKCCGREGAIESIQGTGKKTTYTIKFDVIPGKDTLVVGLTAAELEKLPQVAAQDLGPIAVGDRVRVNAKASNGLGATHVGKSGTTTNMVGKAFMVQFDKSGFALSFMPEELDKLPADPSAAPTPSKAAQAQRKGAAKPAAPAKEKVAKKPTAKKTKAKADPAATTSPNEPAAPAKTSALKPADAWPFTTGSRPNPAQTDAQKLEAAGQERLVP